MKKKYILVCNQINTNKKKLKSIKKLEDLIRRENFIEVFYSNSLEDAERIYGKFKNKNFDYLIVVGGDGSFNFAINKIIKYNLEDKILGYIPSGTANILKYEAKIPDKADYILNFLTLSKVKKINLVQINENYFFLMAGIGFDAKIVASINTKIKKYLGKIIFFLKGIWHFLFLKNKKIEVEINSEKIMADWVLCTNSKYYAGPYSITNETNIFEDKIVTYIFKDLTRLNLLNYVWSILTKGDLASAKGVIKKDLDRLKIVGVNNKLLYQIDGEDCGYHNLIEIRKSEKSINLLVP